MSNKTSHELSVSPTQRLPRYAWMPLTTVLFAACGGSSAQSAAANCPPSSVSPPPQPPPAGAPAEEKEQGPGHLDSEILRLARTTEKLEGVKIRVDEKGQVEKLAAKYKEAGEMPAAVMKALEAYPEKDRKGYEVEHRKDLGKTYEVTVKEKGVGLCEKAFDANGKLLYSECELSPGKLPKELKEAAATVVEKIRIKKVEVWNDKDGNPVHYDVEGIGKDKKVYFLKLKPSGELLAFYMKAPAEIYVALPKPTPPPSEEAEAGKEKAAATQSTEAAKKTPASAQKPDASKNVDKPKKP